MASKAAKEAFVSKLGLKSDKLKSGTGELDRLRRENAQLKKALDDLKNQNGKCPPPYADSEKAKLLERILTLETLRERNARQLLSKDQELEALRQQVRAGSGKVVNAMLDQLEQRQKDGDQREKLFAALSLETEQLKKQLVSARERCKEREKCSASGLQVPSGDFEILQEQLRDVLEKNQQWLVYDQQREAYVQGILAKMVELKQQLDQHKDALQQSHKDTDSKGQPSTSVKDMLLQNTQLELAEERAEAGRLRAQLEELRERCEEHSLEATRAHQDERNTRKALEEKRKLAEECASRLQTELKAASAQLEEEKKRSAELMMQVNLLQKSLVSQCEEQRRLVALEQQVRLSPKPAENEKLNCEIMQQQLHKVMRELGKAREQIANLELLIPKRDVRLSEPSSYDRLNSEWARHQDRILIPTSPIKSPSKLDESFLECPNCRTSYPTSQHRELLAHLDYCVR